MRRTHLLIVTLTLVVLTGALWAGLWRRSPPSDWDRIANPYYGWGSPIERVARLVPPVHRYFYPPLPPPIFVCPTTPAPTNDATL
jgi:4-amino-4-deoxy-L-arabinose transferase-like glycosyltransferase